MHIYMLALARVVHYIDSIMWLKSALLIFLFVAHTLGFVPRGCARFGHYRGHSALQATPNLQDLTRAELQKVAKANGIKANLASAEIIRQMQGLALAAIPARDEQEEKEAKKKKTAPQAVRAPIAAAPVAATAAPKKAAAAAASPKPAPEPQQPRQALPPQDKVLWSTDAFPAEQVEGWWKDLGKPLMTVGSKGVADSHVSSLRDLLMQHDRVRVKFASDKVDALRLAQALVSTGPLKDNTELLVVKPRGLMVGRAQSPATAWPVAAAAYRPSRANSMAVCYGCGAVGHHRVECPNKKRADWVAVGIHPEAQKVEAMRAQQKDGEKVAKKKTSASASASVSRQVTQGGGGARKRAA